MDYQVGGRGLSGQGPAPSLTAAEQPPVLQGTLNLLAAAQQAGVKRVILISSIGTDDLFFPLNLAFGILFFKKRGGEEQLLEQAFEQLLAAAESLACRGGNTEVRAHVHDHQAGCASLHLG